MQAWIMLIIPVFMGAYGLALLFNLFGQASSMAEFYRGRDDWYPILDGDKTSTHRFAGWSMLSFAVTLTFLFWRTGLLL
ncbi:MAG TPA: hypothetical protein VNV65_06495 [Candidatus Solibacter sp.]|jgi:hypothetical protein|nr:hypothetical protein [Candidatus Solibacter sp.]